MQGQRSRASHTTTLPFARFPFESSGGGEAYLFTIHASIVSKSSLASPPTTSPTFPLASPPTPTPPRKSSTTPMLSSLVRLPPPPTDMDIPVEDIFSAALGLIFTDDLRNQHGDPGSSVIYKSKSYGDMELRLNDPAGEDSRKLFSHYLWNAGVQMAEYVGEERGEWSVEGEKVLELGAGTGLAGIVCALAEAEVVVISDYPAPEILANIDVNVNKNVPQPHRSRTSVKGHEWGVFTDGFSTTYANSFGRIVAADCLWMPYEHRALAQSMFHFLSHEDEARVWVIAGFHTGRAKLAPFFDVVVEEGLEVESIWERDVDGHEREWMAERDGGKEDVTGRKRWLVVAVLKRKRRDGG